jgi:hypothetical protein
MENTESKKPRERSKEYPLFTLKNCIEFTDTINSKLGNRFSSAEQIAKTFGKSISTLGSILSSCKQYDLLDLKKGDGYKPTEWYYKVTRGRTEDDKKDATLHCLKSPVIYNDLLEKFNGEELPTDLPAIFYWDYSITEGAKDGAAKIFLENIENLGLIASDGTLQISEDIPKPIPEITLPLTITQAQQIAAQKTPQVSINKIPELTIGNKRADIKVSPGRFVTLDFPFDITTEEIDKLIKNLELWKD